MKIKKSKTLAKILVGTILVGFLGTGCSLVQVNPEKDKAQVIAEIDGATVPKEEFNNYLAYYQMYFDMSGMTFPTGAEFKKLKSDLLDDLIQVKTMTTQAKKDGITIDEAAATADSDSMINNFKTSLEEGKYTSTLEKYNTTAESFEAFLKNFVLENSYANKLVEEFNKKLKEDPGKELNIVVGTINDEEIKKESYNYYLANEEFQTYYQTQKPLETDEESMKITNQTIFNTIATQMAITNYAKEKNLTPVQADLDANIASHKSLVETLLPGDEALQQYLDQKYLTLAHYREFEKQEATAESLKFAIQKEMESKAEVSEKEIQKYYDENKASYDPSTVSAQHILTEDQALADQIYAEAKDVKTKEEFNEIMKKYETNEGVQEAADLGAFTFAKMVEPFSKASFSAKVGDVIKPVKTDFGYHIIYVYDKIEAEIPDVSSKTEEITKTLKNEKATTEFTKFTEDLLKKQKIEIGEIVFPAEAYVDQLKTDLNVKVHKNKI